MVTPSPDKAEPGKRLKRWDFHGTCCNHSPSHADGAGPALSLRERDRDTRPRLGIAPYSGMLSCFFQGLESSLPFGLFKPRTIRRRVPCGMITSSI